MSKSLSLCLVLIFSIALAFGSVPTGKWKMTAEGPDGNTYKFELIIKDEGGKLTGSIGNTEAGTLELQDVAFKDDELTFKLDYQDIGLISFKLHLEGDSLKGTLVTPDGDSGAVSGTR
jgi:hypothetical protein